MDDLQEPQDFDEVDVSVSAPEEDVSDQLEADTPNESKSSEEDKVSFDERQQAKVNELIGQKVGAQRAAERRAIELEKELEETRSKLPEQTVPEIPPLPDPDSAYEDPNKYRSQIEAREKALIERAKFDAAQQAREALTQQQAYRKQVEQQQKQQETVNSYTATAATFGIDSASMQADAATVSQVLPGEVSEGFLNDPHGPLITKFLAGNAMELDKISRMSLYEAASYIATEVKPKLTGTKQKSAAPRPVSIVNGAGAPEKEHPALVGAVFK